MMEQFFDLLPRGPERAVAIAPAVSLHGMVAGILAGKSMPATFDDDQTLAEIGIASVDMVTLLLAVESEFDIEVPAHEITAEVFRSVATIEALIRRLLPHLAVA